MKIAVCCHDAGGSEVVAAWVAANPQNQYRFFLKGPSVKIFERYFGSLEMISAIPSDVDLVLTSTSWASGHELECIRDAKKNTIRSASYIDHWVNYRERFGYPDKDWMENLPDEVWYGDEYAYDLLINVGFSNGILKYVENEYFKSQKAECYKYKDSRYDYLYVCEPIADHMKKTHGDPLFLGYDEFSSMEFFCSKIINTEVKVLIRLHPSEKKGKYNNYLTNLVNVTISEGTTLQEDIGSASIIVGCESMAMVMAVLAGKKVYSIIPGSRERCRIPFKEIMMLGEMSENFR